MGWDEMDFNRACRYIRYVKFTIKEPWRVWEACGQRRIANEHLLAPYAPYIMKWFSLPDESGTGDGGKGITSRVSPPSASTL